jgi:hypothetical protein
MSACEAEMKTDGRIHVLYAGVEHLHHLIQAARQDPVCRFVELHMPAPGVHDIPQFLVDVRHQRPGDLTLVLVHLTRIDAKRLGDGALESGDEGLIRARARIEPFRDDAVAVGHGHRLQAAKGVELIRAGIAQLARGFLRLQAVDLVVEVPGEVSALHFTVGDDIHAGLLHVHDCQVDGVLQCLVDVGRAHLAGSHSLAHDPHPAWHAAAADDLGGDDREISVGEHGIWFLKRET